MKINIITQPLFLNYGGILQNYALQEVLRRFGHEAITINLKQSTVSKYPRRRDFAYIPINFWKHIMGKYNYPFLNPHTVAVKVREMSGPLMNFVSAHIDCIDIDPPYSAETARLYPADLWIVGSDQVWRPIYTSHINNYFFDFLTENENRISYAASFGVDRWEFTEQNTEYIRTLLKKFSALSVRETSGVKLCRKYVGLDAKQVLDPTLLLNAEDYLSLINNTENPEHDYIATYILDNNRNKHKIIKQESKRFQLSAYRIGEIHKDSIDSLESWIATIANAKYVITDSFHGCVFSIIFNKPVKILGNEERGNTRIDSLVSTLGLKVNNDGYYVVDEAVEKKLKDLKEESLLFLITSLSCIKSL